jgi:hypothetical protein
VTRSLRPTPAGGDFPGPDDGLLQADSITISAMVTPALVRTHRHRVEIIMGPRKTRSSNVQDMVLPFSWRRAPPGIAPEEDRDVVTEVVTTVFGRSLVLYRSKTQRRTCDLWFGRLSWLRQDRGLCLSVCCI